MNEYKRVLLAVDFFADNDKIIDRASQIAQDNGAELLLVHAVEPLVAPWSGDGMAGWSPAALSVQTELRDEARKKLQELASRLDVKKENAFLADGRASTEIHRLAREQDVDLIVLGTHGQHGIGLLLGSTANAVLHDTPCDVLAIRTGKE